MFEWHLLPHRLPCYQFSYRNVFVSQTGVVFRFGEMLGHFVVGVQPANLTETT